MAKALAIAALVWPLLLGLSVERRVHNPSSIVAAVTYAAGSWICHQRPERSFHTAGVAWPVCARCSGLYAAAPLGAMVALWSLTRRRPAARRVFWLALSALPTVVTVAIEWAGIAAPSNSVRTVSALPLGAALAFVLVRTIAGEPQAIEYTDRTS